MQINKIRALDINEIYKQLKLLQHKLVEMRFAHKAKQLKNYSEIKLFRKDIAKILTVINEKKFLGQLPKPANSKQVKPAIKLTKKEDSKKKTAKANKEKADKSQKKTGKKTVQK